MGRMTSEDGSTDHTIDEAAAARQRRTLVGILAATLILGAGVGLLAGLTKNHHRQHADHSSVGRIVGITVLVVVVVLTLGWASWLYRRPSYRRLMQYGWRRRMRVAKALRNGRPLAEEDGPVADVIVATLRHQRWFPWVYAVLGAVWVANGFAHHGLARWLWVGGGIGYLTVLLPLVVSQRRKTITNFDRDCLIGASHPDDGGLPSG